MNDLLSLLKEKYNIEIVKRADTELLVKCLKPDMLKLVKNISDLNNIADNITASIKIYHLGSEKQYDIYKLYLISNTSLDIPKLTSILKEQININ